MSFVTLGVASAILLAAGFITIINGATDRDTRIQNYVNVPNSCVGLEDGTHILKLLPDTTKPLVSVECSNEMMIIDVSQDENLLEYFSSNIMWHMNIMGPTNDDHVTWHDWWLPSAEETEDEYDENSQTQFEFLFSEQCNTCDDITSGHFAETPEDEAGYVPYMTGNMFNCFWTVRGIHSYDFNWETSECYYHVSGASDLVNDKDYNKPCDPPSSTELTYAEIQSFASHLPGACATMPMNPTYEVAEFHDDCSINSDYLYKPSIGTNGKNCVCVKPSTKHQSSHRVLKSTYTEFETIMKQKQLELALSAAEDSDSENEDTDEDVDAATSKITYLYQSDFETGTYRITKSGTYMVMEDIEFDFNSGDLNEADAWMPHNDQADDYPGAGTTSFRDQYFLGFFAGITVEADNVIIDLNGFTLQQSLEFYYQQRWFSIIELASQSFYPSQGPGFLGANPIFPNNVEIMNGKLGLTAHHGIHGNNNKNVRIHDLEITQFETHGIQLNGFENLELYNLHIHDSSQIAFLRGEYGHARMLLPRIKYLMDHDVSELRVSEDEYNALKYNPDSHSVRAAKNVGSYTADYTVESDDIGNNDFLHDLYDDMMDQMNMVLDYVKDYNLNQDYDSTQWSTDATDWNDRSKYTEWLKAKENFLYLFEEDDVIGNPATSTNSNGLPFGSSVYGIFLSYHGANILTFGNCEDTSENVILQDIEIHGLRHKMHEYVRLDFVTTPFNSLIDMSMYMSNVNSVGRSHYVGNTMTDAYAAIDYLTNNWGILQMLNLMSNELAQIALGIGDASLAQSFTKSSVLCNADAQTHGGKGTIGLRLDGIDQFAMENIHIYDLYDYTKEGSNVCGEYTTKSKGHFLQTLPMQYGFSGNMVHGIHVVQSVGSIAEVYIHDIGSASGLAHGLSIYTGSTVELNRNIKVSNVIAGFQLDTDSTSWDSAPNRAPDACGVMFYWAEDIDIPSQRTDSSKQQVIITTSDEDSLNIVNECIVGHTGCFDLDYYGATMAGSYKSCKDAYASAVKPGIQSAYRSTIDKKLLALKDTSNTLNDFESKGDTMDLDSSLSYFMYDYLGNTKDSNKVIDYTEQVLIIIGALVVSICAVLVARRLLTTYYNDENMENKFTPLQNGVVPIYYGSTTAINVLF